jgi:hypothetical protein
MISRQIQRSGKLRDNRVRVIFPPLSLRFCRHLTRNIAEYRSSTTYRSRSYFGPTEAAPLPVQYDWSNSQSPRGYDSGISAQRNLASAQSYSSTYAPPQRLQYTVQRYNAAGGPSDP